VVAGYPKDCGQGSPPQLRDSGDASFDPVQNCGEVRPRARRSLCVATDASSNTCGSPSRLRAPTAVCMDGYASTAADSGIERITTEPLASTRANLCTPPKALHQGAVVRQCVACGQTGPVKTRTPRRVALREVQTRGSPARRSGSSPAPGR